MTDVLIDARRGAGSSLEILYGTVTWKPTLTHSRGTSIVLPAPTTYDLVDGQVVATNVQPTPAPVAGQIEWAYEVTFKDRHSKSYSFLVGVPNSTSQVNFISLPRYFETKPPLFGAGPKGDPGESATVAVGSVTGGATAQVNNSGTNTEAVLNFVLPEGPQGPPGDGFTYMATPPQFTDPSSTYPVGSSYFILSAPGTTGWERGYLTGVTVRRINGRTVQTITYNDGRQFIRTDGGSEASWTPLKENAWTDPATTTANGLMSSADKSKLDNLTLPANTKLPEDLSSTYPEGISVTNGLVRDGWPAVRGSHPSFTRITTERVRVLAPAIQRASAYVATPPAGGNVDDNDILYRTSKADGTWGEWQTIASQGWVSDQLGTVTPEQFGAVGDGTTDDSDALEQAIAYSMENAKTVLLDPQKTYGVTRTITNTVVPTTAQDAGKYCVSIRSSQEGKTATIRVLDSVGISSARVVLNFRGGELPSTILTGSTQMQTRRWYVGAGTYFRKGCLFAVESSLPWYYDPRTSTSDARKGELHRVESTDGRYIFSESPAEDGYILSDESVTVRPYSPIRVKLRDLEIYRTLPPESLDSDDLRRVALQVSYAIDSEITNVDTYGGTAKGIGLVNSYNSVIKRGRSVSSNNYFEGYGVQTQGTNYCVVDGRYIASSRRGIDVSQGGKISSWNTIVRNCTVVGGGINSRGVFYNYSPVDGSLGDSQSGMGTHGPAGNTTYLNNIIRDCHAGITIRGLNETVKGNRLIGRFRQNAIAISDGGGVAVIEGNTVISGWNGSRKSTNILDAGANINTRRAASFLWIYPNYDTVNGEVIVTNNYAEVQDIFIQFGISSASAVPKRATITNNVVMFASSNSTTDRYALYNPVAGELIGGNYRWTHAVNRYSNQAGTGSILQTRGINLASAYVLDMVVSGSTT